MTRYTRLARPAERDPATCVANNAVGQSRFTLVLLNGYRCLLAAVASVLVGCAAPQAMADEPKGEEAQRQWLEFMTRKVDGFVISTEKRLEQPLARVKDSVLRYSNPVRENFAHGAIFLWLSGERPMVAASMWLGADGKVRREFTSLTDEPLRCVREGQTIWAPRSGTFARKPLPDAPKPASTPASRLAQMRRLAERFSADFDPWPAKGWEELRLLAQPLYRYAAADQGVADGAIFALAQANDPEVLIVLELARPAADAAPAWSYALARMSSKRMRARLDGKEVWSVDAYYSKPRAPEDPYQEAEEGKYPGTDGAKIVP
jgi:hypothetical protein